MDAAEDARRAGRFDEERHHFAQASAHAKKPKDKGEARYRSAESHVRQGRYESGATELESFATQFPESERAARAWLDAGRAWERAEEHERALDAYEMVVQRYPDSGGAVSAARRIVGLTHERSGAKEYEVWRNLLANNSSRPLDEPLRYYYAQALEEVSPERAILAYEDVARHHPLPSGSYSDEALLRAAELRREAGDGTGALVTLTLLVEQGGAAAFVGSYTRTAYVKALLLRGRILRDDLNRPDEARQTFLALAEKHPTSRLVDDALWENVVTLNMQGKDACQGMTALKRASPESRYLRCNAFICETTPKPHSRQQESCEKWLSGIR